MSQLTVTIPDDVLEEVSHFANVTGKSINEVIVEALSSSIPPLSGMLNPPPDITTISDEHVIHLTELQMETWMSDQLNELIERQKAGRLTFEEHAALQGLLQIYQVGTLLKARALSEAVRRKLRPPLEP